MSLIPTPHNRRLCQLPRRHADGDGPETPGLVAARDHRFCRLELLKSLDDLDEEEDDEDEDDEDIEDLDEEEDEDDLDEDEDDEDEDEEEDEEEDDEDGGVKPLRMETIRSPDFGEGTPCG